MTIKRIRTTRLESAGHVASEHAQVYRKFKQGKLDGATASRMSAILVNHRVIIETVKSEERIQELEQMVAELKAQQARPATLRVV
jgi:polyhydroxyalkanoate synthesis regulator phasin